MPLYLPAPAALPVAQVQARTPGAALLDRSAFLGRAAVVQRAVAAPVFEAARLRQAYAVQRQAERTALHHQVESLQRAVPAGALELALQRRQAAQQRPNLPAAFTAPNQKRSAGDWAGLFRYELGTLKPYADGSYPAEPAKAIQRRAAEGLLHTARTSSLPPLQRQAEVGAALANIQRQPLGGMVVGATLKQLPKAELPAIQRALDDHLQRLAEQDQHDAQAMQLHALQRQLGEAPHDQSDSEVMRGIQAQRGAGNPLPEAVQRQLEQGLNADLSGVRVHTGAEADKLSRRVGAKAFTTGQDIFFRNGTYDPHSPSGLELVAHEATHTVQQAQGRAKPGVDADAGLEREARQMGKRLIHSSPTPDRLERRDKPSYARNSSGRAIQRYGIGNKGHGGLEEKALGAAGFTEEEIGQVYAGNFLRDASQFGTILLSPEITRRLPPLANKMIREFSSRWSQALYTIALGISGKRTSIKLGSYVASEHLDNPNGGGRSLFFPGAAEDKYNPDLKAANLQSMSPNQREIYARLESQRDLISQGAAQSGLAAHVARGRLSAQLRLQQAETAKGTERFPLLGSALHTIEDFFAHSNFVEVALAQLQNEKGSQSGPARRLTEQTFLKSKAATSGGPIQLKLGRQSIATHAITTGSYATYYDIIHSFMESAGTGSYMKEKFIVGSLCQRGINHSIAKKAVSTYFGAKEGIKPTGEKVKNVGDIIKNATGEYESFKRRLKLIYKLLKPTLKDVGLEEITRRAERAAEEHRGPKGEHQPLGVTHAALAKDGPKNPLHTISTLLAQQAVTAFGQNMKFKWRDSKAGEDWGVLLDRYIAHPSVNPWWRPTMIASLKNPSSQD